MKFRLVSIPLFVLCAVLVAGVHSSPAAPSPQEKVVAKVDGVAITEFQLEKAIDQLVPRAFFHGGITPEKRKEFRPKALRTLINGELYFQAAKKQGMTVSKAELKESLDGLRKKFKSEKEYQRALKDSGYTESSLERQLEKNFLVRKFIDAEITKKAEVTDAYLKDYYAKHEKDYIRPEAFKLRHILIKVEALETEAEKKETRKKAEDVLAKAKAGEDFGELAYKYSMDAWRVKGGDLGIVHKGMLDPALEAVAEKLKPGEVSGIIETMYGYHILKLEEKLPPQQMTFDEVKDKLKAQLEKNRREEIEKDLLKRLKDAARIEVFE